MKKKLALILASVMAMGCIATGCGNKAAETTKETSAESAVETTAAESGDKMTFTVGFDASFPPYGYQENGEYVGPLCQPAIRRVFDGKVHYRHLLPDSSADT